MFQGHSVGMSSITLSYIGHLSQYYEHVMHLLSLNGYSSLEMCALTVLWIKVVYDSFTC